MPRRKHCHWTRKLELQLVEFVRHREFIWKPYGNTNHHIQQKYKAYAEFASKLGHGFTARSVRDRWVNIRCTFNHNLRRVDKSKLVAQSPAEIYVPCWPLWKPLQFLRESQRKEDEVAFEGYQGHAEFNENPVDIKLEDHSDIDDTAQLRIRQRGRRNDGPHRKLKGYSITANKCSKVIKDLVITMKPLTYNTEAKNTFWFFGKHVTERLNCMQQEHAQSAREAIMELLNGLNTDFKMDNFT